MVANSFLKNITLPQTMEMLMKFVIMGQLRAEGGFFHKSRLGNGVALTGGRIIVPVDFHVIFDDLALPLSHTGKPPF